MSSNNRDILKRKQGLSSQGCLIHGQECHIHSYERGVSEREYAIFRRECVFAVDDGMYAGDR